MRIAVVGPGAMGTLFGGLLARAGHEVWMLGRRPEMAAALARGGIRVEGLADFAVRVAGATVLPEALPPADLALVTVKAYDTAGAAETVAALAGPPSLVLTLQNGAGNVEALAARLGAERILAGTTAMGATYLGPGRVRLAGAGETVIGYPEGPPDAAAIRLAETFTSAGIPTATSARIREAIWRKLIVNCAINAPAALARVPNGALPEAPGLWAVAMAAAREAAVVGEALGYDTPPAVAEALVREVCRATAPNLNSMLQDVLAGRPTEVGAINGYVAEQAATQGLSAPANGLLADLVRGSEQSYQRRV